MLLSAAERDQMMHNLIYWLSEDLRSNTWLVHSAFEESLKSINDLVWARRGMIPVLVCNVIDCPLLESSLCMIVVNSPSDLLSCTLLDSSSSAFLDVKPHSNPQTTPSTPNQHLFLSPLFRLNQIVLQDPKPFIVPTPASPRPLALIALHLFKIT